RERIIPGRTVGERPQLPRLGRFGRWLAPVPPRLPRQLLLQGGSYRRIPGLTSGPAFPQGIAGDQASASCQLTPNKAATARRGGTAPPPGSSSPVSSNNTTPLHSRLQPCSG